MLTIQVSIALIKMNFLELKIIKNLFEINNVYRKITYINIIIY